MQVTTHPREVIVIDCVSAAKDYRRVVASPVMSVEDCLVQ